MPSANRKQQRLARAFSDAHSIPYQQALRLVVATSADTDAPGHQPFGLPAIADPYRPLGGLLPLGVGNDGQTVGMPNRELDSHLLVCGQTGCGKSELMLWLAHGIAQAGHPMVLLDTHGALTEDMLSALAVHCPDRESDIVLCDLSDPDWPVAVNPLDIRSMHEVELVVQSVSDMLAVATDTNTLAAPRALNLAAQALSAMCEANLHLTDPDTKCTLLDLPRFFTDVELRRLVMEFCSDPVARATFDPEVGPFELLSEQQQTEQAMPITRALAPLTSSPTLAAGFGAGANRLDFTQLICGNAIALVKLARYTHQKRAGELTGALLLPWLYASMDSWGRRLDPVTGQATGRGARIIVENAPALIGANRSIVNLMEDGRKWDAGLVLGCQYPGQFRPEVRREMLATTQSKLSFQLAGEEAGGIINSLSGATEGVTAADIAGLEQHAFYANALVSDGDRRRPSGPVLCRGLEPLSSELDTESAQRRQRIIARSRDRVAVPAAERAEYRRHALEHVKSGLGQMLIARAGAAAEEYALDFAASVPVDMYDLRLDYIHMASDERDSDDTGLPELADSLSADGQREPVQVRPAAPDCGHGKPYELVFGRRRLLAARVLDWESIRAEVISEPRGWSGG